MAQVEGILFDLFSQTELESMLDSFKSGMVKQGSDGSTIISYSVGGKTVTRGFLLPGGQAQMLLELQAALKRLDPSQYGVYATQTVARFS